MKKKENKGEYKIIKDVNNYFKDGRDYNNDVIQYAEFIKDLIAPSTMKVALSETYQ